MKNIEEWETQWTSGYIILRKSRWKKESWDLKGYNIKTTTLQFLQPLDPNAEDCNPQKAYKVEPAERKRKFKQFEHDQYFGQSSKVWDGYDHNFHSLQEEIRRIV